VAQKLFTVEEVLTILAATPKRFAELTAGLSETQLHKGPTPGEWSANDVLAHVRACADVRGGAVLKIVVEDRPTFRAMDPRDYMLRTDYPRLDFRPSLRSFTRQRARLLTTLKALPSEGWSRAATVTGAGAPLQRTVLFYASWVARHERPHVRQMARIVEALG